MSEQYTHQIVSMKRRATQNSQSPMWACRTKDNEWVNIFKHVDPTKNTYRFFGDYWPEMDAMLLDTELRWEKSPLDVILIKNGKWWDIVGVAPRQAGAAPDPIYKPDLAWYCRKARCWAKMLRLEQVIYLDTETTGTGPFAEIISIGCLNNQGLTKLQTLVKPRRMEAVAATTGIHGITPDDLVAAPTLPELWGKLDYLLHRRPWVAYNASFDVAMLQQDLEANGLGVILPTGIHDAMQLYAEFAGLWDQEAQRWQKVKLVEAAQALDIEVDQAHDALADTTTMYRIVARIAASDHSED